MIMEVAAGIQRKERMVWLIAKVDVKNPIVM